MNLTNSQGKEDDVDVLIMVLDMHMEEWGIIGFEEFVKVLRAFVNSFILVSPQNEFVLIACGSQGAQYLYPRDVESNEQPFISVMDEISVFLSNEEKIEAPKIPKLSKGVSMALCYSNACMKKFSTKRPRILLVQVSEDNVSDYVAMMNCIVAAQKLGTPIDCCNLNRNRSNMLQQACFTTDGVYAHITDIDRLLCTMIVSFLPSLYSRSFLCMSKVHEVDFRASCFCHHELIDRGFICPVCLASKLNCGISLIVFCKKAPTCPMCRTRFPPSMDKIKRKLEGIK